MTTQTICEPSDDKAPHASDPRVASVLETIRHLWLEASRREDPAWLSVDLTRAQMKAVMVLGACGPLSVGQVGQHLGISLPTSSQLVERLVAAGIVERAQDPHDRRVAVCRLHPHGEDLYHNLAEEPPRRLAGWLTHLQPAALDALQTGLTALLAAVAATPIPPRPESREDSE